MAFRMYLSLAQSRSIKAASPKGYGSVRIDRDSGGLNSAAAKVCRAR